MPTYDYRCRDCDHAFEHFQSISSPLLRKCPKCGRSRLERLIGTGGGLLFKGSGFYVTDYRSSSYREAAAKDGASSPAGSAESSGSSAARDRPADGAKAPARSRTPSPRAKKGRSSPSKPG
jgi:putative FmdB family regulatory protein